MLFRESFYDVPSQQPHIKIPLDRVSIFNQKVPAAFSDDLFQGERILFDIKAGSPLSLDQRGIHMSRIEQAFQNLPTELPLTDLALHIARKIQTTQHQEGAELHLKGTSILKRETNVTHLASYEPITVMAHAIVGEKEEVGIGIGATMITACPCMQAYSLDEIIRTFNLSVEEPEALVKKIPIATHSQKGHVVAYISGSPETMGNLRIKDIYQILSRGTHLTWELLKRPDEYDLVRKAHLNAQFVEDVARSILARAYEELKDFDSSLMISVDAKSFESIHGHDIEAKTQLTLGQLRSLYAEGHPFSDDSTDDWGVK